MPRFQVEVREQWCATYWVDAESEEDARNKVKSGTLGPDDTEFVDVMG
jgi:DNA-dependent RNA polymerase auxiliary subunit epsilon